MSEHDQQAHPPATASPNLDSSKNKIDVHAHFIPPFYQDYLTSAGYPTPDGMPGVPAWSPESHLAFINSTGIKKSILSLSSPGVSILTDPHSTADLCRRVNEYASSLKKSYPSQFGFFASLPLPDIASTLAEIDHAHKVLHCDGFILMSNSLGVYLGDPCLRPVFAALNKINARVFVHPTAPCCRDAGHHELPPQERFRISSPLAAHYRTPLMEFFFDSARSLLDLVLSGTATRFPDIRWLASHAGNVIPSLLDRMCILPRAGMPLTTSREALNISEPEIRRVFREQFWYDLAGLPVPGQIHALLGITGVDRLMVGSDVPWTPFGSAAELMRDVDEYLPNAVKGEGDIQRIWSGNAERFLSI